MVDPAALDRILLTYLASVAQLLDSKHRDWRYGSYEALVLNQGRRMAPARLPPGIQRGEPRKCYANTLALVRASGWRFSYVEGFGLPTVDGEPVIATQHAWAADEQGTVIDTTWTEPEHAAYYGIVFSRGEVERFDDLGIDYLGILPSEYRLRFPLLRYGELFPVPSEAPSIRCPLCGRDSFNPNDIDQAYCPCCGAHDGSLPKDCRHTAPSLGLVDTST